jgi:hypothetical protein
MHILQLHKVSTYKKLLVLENRFERFMHFFFGLQMLSICFSLYQDDMKLQVFFFFKFTNFCGLLSNDL